MNTKILKAGAWCACALLFFGCARGSSTDDKDARAIAIINGYRLTVEDLRQERLTNPPKPEKELLEDLIIRKLLIQEAQDQDFDKESAFTREIEKYWEQALLKLLIQRKTEEFSREIGIKGDEARDELVRQRFLEWVAELREKASVTIDDNALEEIEKE